MSPSRWPRSRSHGKCSRRYCGSLRNCGRSHHQRQRETFDGHAFKNNRQQECAQMPRENGQIRHSNAARTAWNAGSHPHRASALHPVQETAITPVCSGLIRGIPVQELDVRNKHILFLSTNLEWGGSAELWSRTALKLAMEGLEVIALVQKSLVAQKRMLELQESGACVLSYPLPVTLWRRARRKLSGKTWSVLDLEELLPSVQPALVVTSDGSALPPIDIAEMFVTKKWPFVSIGQSNCERWWPSDELAARYRKILPAALRCYFVSNANQRVAEIHLGCKIENAEVVRNPFNVVYDAAPPPWPPIDVNSELRLACVARL